MRFQPRSRKRVYATRRAPDGSAFQTWEKFTESCVDEDFIEVDRKGFQTWKNMSLEERQPYINQAEAVNSAYQKLLDEEVNDMFQVDDEADSAMVGKFDPFYEDFEKSGDDFIFKWYGGSESFESDKGGMGHMHSSWIVEDSS